MYGLSPDGFVYQVFYVALLLHLEPTGATIAEIGCEAPQIPGFCLMKFLSSYPAQLFEHLPAWLTFRA